MNWEAMGAVAEAVGALSMIVTLVYLALQIRENTRAVKGQAIGNFTQNVLTEVLPFVGPDIGRIFLKALEDEASLTLEESAQLDAWMVASFTARQNEFAQYQLGVLDEQIWQSTHQAILENLGHQYGRQWWETLGKPRFSADFVEFVESLDWRQKDGAVLLGAAKRGSA